jgi:hypothetical protein
LQQLSCSWRCSPQLPKEKITWACSSSQHKKKAPETAASET